MPTPADPVDLLWTGGWDSTFRLLQLVVAEGRAVRPHYVEAPVRAGTSYELAAMERIRQRLAGRGLGDLLAPLRTTVEDDIAPDPRTKPWIVGLRARSMLGWQYEYLSRYAREVLPEGGRLELSVHLDDKAEAFLRPHVVRRGDTYVMRDEVSDEPMRLFEPFSFPLLDVTKEQMDAAARRGGFSDLMDLTWFCHSPRNGEPCGTCNPCVYTYNEGMGHRLPRAAHMRRRAARARRVAGRLVRPARQLAGRLLRTAGLRP